eukprot:73506-Chlamydomonas_euryale.AAC.6
MPLDGCYTGYCQISCGRCNCCSTFSEALRLKVGAHVRDDLHRSGSKEEPQWKEVMVAVFRWAAAWPPNSVHSVTHPKTLISYSMRSKVKTICLYYAGSGVFLASESDGVRPPAGPPWFPRHALGAAGFFSNRFAQAHG